MSNQVTFDPTVGGDGSTVSDGRDAVTGLDAGGWRSRFVPALAQIVAIATWVKNRALDVYGYASAASGSAADANGSAAAAAGSAAQAANSATSIIATSATNNVAIGAAGGTRTLTVQANKSFQAGQAVTASDQASNAKYVFGAVSSYNSATGALVISVSAVGGSGTPAGWNVSVSGIQGPTGPQGPGMGVAQAYYMSTLR